MFPGVPLYMRSYAIKYSNPGVKRNTVRPFSER